MSVLRKRLEQLKDKPLKIAGIEFIEDNFYLEIDKDTHEITNNKKPFELPEGTLLVITPYANGYFSDWFLTESLKAGIQIFKMDFFGNPIWELNPKTRTKATLMQAQVLLNEPEFNKIRGELIINTMNKKFQSEAQPIPKYITIPKESLNVSWINKVMSLEGERAKNYFENYTNKQYFKDMMKHRGSGTRSEWGKTNKNAQDYINVLLNLGYGLLAHKIGFEAYKRGLEPTIGFYHSYDIHDNRYSLVWDIIEPYRVIIDNIVKEMANQDKIDTNDFIFDVLEEKRFLMIQEEPHAFGKLSQSAYKEYIKRFIGKSEQFKANIPIPKEVFDMFKDYEEALRKVLEIKKYKLDKINRTLSGFKKTGRPIKPEPEKPIEEETHKPNEEMIK